MRSLPRYTDFRDQAFKRFLRLPTLFGEHFDATPIFDCLGPTTVNLEAVATSEIFFVRGKHDQNCLKEMLIGLDLQFGWPALRLRLRRVVNRARDHVPEDSLFDFRGRPSPPGPAKQPWRTMRDDHGVWPGVAERYRRNCCARKRADRVGDPGGVSPLPRGSGPANLKLDRLNPRRCRSVINVADHDGMRSGSALILGHLRAFLRAVP